MWGWGMMQWGDGEECGCGLHATPPLLLMTHTSAPDVRRSTQGPGALGDAPTIPQPAVSPSSSMMTPLCVAKTNVVGIFEGSGGAFTPQDIEDLGAA